MPSKPGRSQTPVDSLRMYSVMRHGSVLRPLRNLAWSLHVAAVLAADFEQRMRCNVQSETSVTISIGVATAETEPPTLEGMVRQADEATYRAKRSGRNRVCA